MGVGINIRNRREKIGMSQGELAEIVGVSQPMIAQIERETKNPSLQVGILIANALGCNVSELTTT